MVCILCEGLLEITVLLSKMKQVRDTPRKVEELGFIENSIDSRACAPLPSKNITPPLTCHFTLPLGLPQGKFQARSISSCHTWTQHRWKLLAESR